MNDDPDTWGPWRRFLVTTVEPQVERWHAIGNTFPWEKVVIYGPSLLRTQLPHKLCWLAIKLHWLNYQIWHHEDLCRSGQPELIAINKQAIDRLNQERNDLVEQIDEQAVDVQNSALAPSGVPYNSEGLGPILDRVSISMLKLYHVTELIGQGQQGLHDRLATLDRQLDFTIDRAEELYDDLRRGYRRIMIFKQLKMYNDPELNPHHGQSTTNQPGR